MIGTGEISAMLSMAMVVRRQSLGLFLGTASSLARGGPAGLLLGYTVVASVCVSGKCAFFNPSNSRRSS